KKQLLLVCFEETLLEVAVFHFHKHFSSNGLPLYFHLLHGEVRNLTVEQVVLAKSEADAFVLVSVLSPHARLYHAKVVVSALVDVVGAKRKHSRLLVK